MHINIAFFPFTSTEKPVSVSRYGCIAEIETTSVLITLFATRWPPPSSPQQPTQFTSETHFSKFPLSCNVLQSPLYSTLAISHADKVKKGSFIWPQFKHIFRTALNKHQNLWQTARGRGCYLTPSFSILFTPQINSDRINGKNSCMQTKNTPF